MDNDFHWRKMAGSDLNNANKLAARKGDLLLASPFRTGGRIFVAGRRCIMFSHYG